MFQTDNDWRRLDIPLRIFARTSTTNVRFHLVLIIHFYTISVLRLIFPQFEERHGAFGIFFSPFSPPGESGKEYIYASRCHWLCQNRIAQHRIG